MPEEEGSTSVDQDFNEVAAAIQKLLREAYREGVEELRFQAAKVKHFNRTKRAIRLHLTSWRQVRSRVLTAAYEEGLDIRRVGPESRKRIADLIGEHARIVETGELETGELAAAEVEVESGPLVGMSPNEVKTKEDLDACIEELEERLATVGDDAQLANIDLQSALQKTQQTLQTMSNVSKMVHDTAMAVVRKIG